MQILHEGAVGFSGIRFSGEVSSLVIPPLIGLQFGFYPTLKSENEPVVEKTLLALIHPVWFLPFVGMASALHWYGSFTKNGAVIFPADAFPGRFLTSTQPHLPG